MVAIRLEKRVQERRRGPHLHVGLEAFEVQDGRHPMLPDPSCDGMELGKASVGIDDDVAEPVGETDEIAFRIDHDLLDVGSALLEKATQEVGFARAGIALDEETGR